MIKSKFFWIAAILLALMPLVALDIPKHVVDLTRDVHDEIIEAVYDSYKLSHQQKVEALDRILSADVRLHAKIYLKSFAAIVLLVLSIVFFVRYRKQEKAKFWKPFGITAALLLISISAKLYSWTSFGGNDHIKLLALTPADSTLSQVYNTYFKGKVVYVDFWGTTCGPCLNEFRAFTKPLKAKYQNRNDIAYLYVSRGHILIWKQQLEKFDVAGSHIFLDDPAWTKMYKSGIKGSSDTAQYMPRYLIMDKRGKVVETVAPYPSALDSISVKLDKYLALN